MPGIMILCPTLNKPVETGLTTEKIVFDSLAGVTIRLQCPACLKIHKWELKDAWVDGVDRRRR